MEKIENGGKTQLVSAWEIQIKNDLRWINDELARSQTHLNDLKTGLATSLSTEQAQDGRLRREYEKEVAVMLKLMAITASFTVTPKKAHSPLPFHTLLPEP